MKPLCPWKPALVSAALLLSAVVVPAQNSSTGTSQAATASQPATATASNPSAAAAPPVATPAAAPPAPIFAHAPACGSTRQRHADPLAPALAEGAPASSEASTAASPADNVQPLHLIVGRSLFLEFPERLHRVYVSNPTVLDAMTVSPLEVVITAKTSGTSTFALWTNGGPPEMYTVFCDIDVAGLRESLDQALPGDRVEVEAQQGRVHLTGVVDSDAAADEAGKLAGIYSKDVVNSLVVDPRHLPQVQLQVRFVEIDRSKLNAFGINLIGLNPTSMGQGSTEQFSPSTFRNNGSGAAAITSDFLNLFYFNIKNGVGATIKDLETKGVLQILAEPNLTTIHGKSAKFLAGGQFPYPIIQPGGVGSVPTVTVQFEPYGVKLEFTPYVNSDGTIRLKVAPEVSTLDYSNEVVIAGYALPALSTRRAETEIELKDGQTFGISGILDNRVTDSLSKVPGIADIPILGQLFRSKNLNRSTMELIVVVTPKIVDALNAPAPPPPTAPAMAVPFLQPKGFDQNLPKN
jgi:pilus assembly protein CpaC